LIVSFAALPKGPNNYHPYRRTQQALARRNEIIGLMAQNGYITADGLAEVIQGCRRDAVQVAAGDDGAEENLVEVEFEDLVLRIGRLDPQRDQRFLDPASRRQPWITSASPSTS
jgi:membrane peptidoglycan carboxypeptidase